MSAEELGTKFNNLLVYQFYQELNEQRLSRNHQKTLQPKSHHIPILSHLESAASDIMMVQKLHGYTIYLDL